MLEGLPQDRPRGGVREPTPHESAHKHVAGEAVYIDDIPEPADALHICLGLSQRASTTSVLQVCMTNRFLPRTGCCSMASRCSP